MNDFTGERSARQPMSQPADGTRPAPGGKHISNPTDKPPQASRNGQGHGGPQPGAGPEIPLSSVQPMPVQWLWDGRIALGKVNFIVGDPEVGKSALSLELAARLTSGRPMPFDPREPGVETEPAGVLVMSAEDDNDDTIVPRIIAAGGDRGYVYSLHEVPEGRGTRPPELPQDIDVIRDVILRRRIKLAILDPFDSFVSSLINTHKSQDVRLVIHRLHGLAKETGAALFVLTHPNKNAGASPMYRVSGSLAIVAAPRSSMVLARDPDDPDLRVLARLKCNIAAPVPSLSFRLRAAPDSVVRLEWAGTSEHTAESLLAAPSGGTDRSAVEEAQEFLKDILANGPLPTNEVYKQAALQKIKDSALKRARRALGIKPLPLGGEGGRWIMRLPTTAGAACRQGDQDQPPWSP